MADDVFWIFLWLFFHVAACACQIVFVFQFFFLVSFDVKMTIGGEETQKQKKTWMRLCCDLWLTNLYQIDSVVSVLLLWPFFLFIFSKIADFMNAAGHPINSQRFHLTISRMHSQESHRNIRIPYSCHFIYESSNVCKHYQVEVLTFFHTHSTIRDNPRERERRKKWWFKCFCNWWTRHALEWIELWTGVALLAVLRLQEFLFNAELSPETVAKPIINQGAFGMPYAVCLERVRTWLYIYLFSFSSSSFNLIYVTTKPTQEL